MLQCKQSEIYQFFKFNGNKSSCSGPVTPILELTRDRMALYRLTKFGADWLIIVNP